MANCIRCGKPCNNGETMCDECKAWFQEKTGGSTIPSAKKMMSTNTVQKRSALGKKKRVEEDSEKTDNSSMSNCVSEGGTNVPISDKNNVQKNSIAVTAGGKNIVISSKILGIAAIAAVTVIVILVLVISKIGKNESNSDQYYAEDTTKYNEVSEDGDIGDYEEVPEVPNAVEVVDEKENIASEPPENIQNIQDKSDDQLEEYYESNASEYILPNSDSQYISKSDLEGLSQWEARVARNEIMARHGRKFRDQELQEYFNGCSWYSGTVEPDDFDKNYEANLNEYEKKNVTTIKNYEKEKGYI